MKFLDQARIYAASGKGGNGAVGFRREKFIEFGGPDGGNGGKGGDVIFEASANLNTLVDFRFKKHFVAQPGKAGQGQRKAGKAGQDVIIQVPIGTQIFLESSLDFPKASSSPSFLEEGEGEEDEEEDEDEDEDEDVADARSAQSTNDTHETRHATLIADLVTPGEQFVLLRGGRGGAGNAAFKSSTNRSPRTSLRGEPGNEALVLLQLKLIADVGIIGLPNAGKSTLLSSVSNAKAKIADYPFTTLHPSLGVVYFGDDGNLLPSGKAASIHRSFTLADTPGLLENASEGVGMGHRFLSHLERCHAFIHLIDATLPLEDIIEAYAILRHELESYDPKMLEKKEIVALSKCERVEPCALQELQEALEDNIRRPIFLVSSHTRQGLQELMWSAYQMLPSFDKEALSLQEEAWSPLPA